MYDFEFDIFNDKQIEYRQKTFVNHSSIKYLALSGLYIIEINGAHYISCCACKKEVEILKYVDKLQINLFHCVTCKFLNENFLSISQNQTNQQKTMANGVDGFCTVEYVVQDDIINGILDWWMPKIEKDQIRSIILYEFKLGCNASEAATNIIPVFHKESINERTTRHWLEKFRIGDESLEDDQGRGRHSTIVDDQLSAIIEAGSCKTNRELTEELIVGHSTVVRHFHQIGKLKKAPQMSAARIK